MAYHNLTFLGALAVLQGYRPGQNGMHWHRHPTTLYDDSDIVARAVPHP